MIIMMVELKLIKKIVEKEFDLKIDRLTRKRDYVMAKWCFYKLGLDYIPKMTKTEIGRYLKQDHATVVNAIKNFNYVTDDPKYNEKYVACLHKIDCLIDGDKLETVDELRSKIIKQAKKISDLKDIIKGKDKLPFEDEIRNLNEEQNKQLITRLDAFFKMVG